MAIMCEDDSLEMQIMIQRILDSIEKRWAKSEQEAFIAAVILNPVYKMTPFAVLDFTTSAGCLVLIKKLYIHLFGSLTSDEDQLLYDELMEYLYDDGCYKNFAPFVMNICQCAKEQVCVCYT